MMTRLLKSKRVRFVIIAMLTLLLVIPFTTQKAQAQQQCFEVWLTTPEVISGPGTYPFAVNYYWPGSGSSWKGNIVFSLITEPPSGVGVNPSRTSVPFQFPGVTGNTITSINVTISFDRIFADNPRDFALTMTAVATATETRGPTCSRFEVRHTYAYKAPAGGGHSCTDRSSTCAWWQHRKV